MEELRELKMAYTASGWNIAVIICSGILPFEGTHYQELI